MATAVIHFEATRPGRRIEVADRYDAALVIVRHRGRPLGHLRLPVVAGRIDHDAFLDRVAALQTAHLREIVGRDLLHREPLGELIWIPQSVTVAVCTRDRPADLRRCLESLQPAVSRGHEVLVVDNAPSDPEIALGAARDFRARHVVEPCPGLSAARNRALLEATGEIVCFLDDDAVAEPAWSERLRLAFSDPLVMCATGLTLPLELETEAQEAFEAAGGHGRGYRKTIFRGAHMNPLAIGSIGAGVNMAVRRSAVEMLGGFDEALGVGSPTAAGEDYDLFSRILAAGYNIVYEPEAVVCHHHRRSMADLVRTYRGYGSGVYAYLTRHLLAGELSAPKMAARWFFYRQLPEILRSLRGRSALPLRAQLAQLIGCIAGPYLYVAARVRHRPPATG